MENQLHCISNTLTTNGVNIRTNVWQISLNPPLQKNNTQTMQLTFGYSWARA